MENVFETLGNLLNKELINDTFKMSAVAILKASGDFIQTGTENGVPVFTLKPDPKCERCGKTDKGCNCDEFEIELIF
jgi:hypothetical protein